MERLCRPRARLRFAPWARTRNGGEPGFEGPSRANGRRVDRWRDGSGDAQTGVAAGRRVSIRAAFGVTRGPVCC